MNHRAHSPVSPFPRGFTLAELIAVMIMMSIMAVAAVPALSRLQTLRHTSLAAEAERRLSIARAYAQAASVPAGVQFDTTNQRITIMQVASTGTAPTALPGSAGGTVVNRIEDLAPGSSITTFSFNGGTTYSTLWFSYRGVPHLRNSSGAFVSNLTSDATITLSGGNIITVRMLTGAIER